MQIKNKRSTKSPFLERVATFDLERYYTPWVRFFCHFSMWMVFTALLQLNLFIDSALPLNQAFAFAVRSLLCNLTIFYLFFYFAVPNTLLKNRVIPTIFSILLCIIIWVLLNHYFILFIADHYHVTSAYYAESVEANQDASIWYIISPEHILVSLTPLFYSLSPFFFTKIVFGIIRFYSQSFKTERKALKLERDFLKAQLNPHFLFNTLNSIYALSLRKDDKAPQTIAQLSEMMRYTLYESDAQLVPLEKELDYIKNHVKLERTRYSQNANIVCEIDDWQVDGQLIAPLLTFTFIENAFKYGLRNGEKGFISLFILVEENTFDFVISNDKEEPGAKTDFGGIGLQNVQKRLQLLYPGRHSLSIKDEEDRFTVELFINLS